MTTLLDTEFQALAVELLEEFAARADGTIATRVWTHIDSVTPTPSAGTAVVASTNHSVVTSPPVAFDPASMRTARNLDPGQLTADGEMYIAIAAYGLAFTPTVNDSVTIDSVLWTVTSVQPVYAGELVALYSARVVS